MLKCIKTALSEKRTWYLPLEAHRIQLFLVLHSKNIIMASERNNSYEKSVNLEKMRNPNETRSALTAF